VQEVFREPEIDVQGSNWNQGQRVQKHLAQEIFWVPVQTYPAQEVFLEPEIDAQGSN